MTDCSTDIEPRGLPLAAKRLAGWTSNLLVLAVVLAMGLTFGRQLTAWWALETREPPRTAPVGTGFLGRDPPGGEQGLQHLEFGDLPIRLGRQSVRGPKAAVFAALRAQCRGDAEHGLRAAREPGPQERKMLQGTAGMTPVEQAPGTWKMYQVDGPLPLVVVTDSQGGTSGGDARSAPTRVLSWGFALPEAAGTKWTLFTCVPTEGLAAPAADPLALPVPPGGQRHVSLRSEDGGGMLLLSGSGDPEEWLISFDAWFREHGWSAEEGRPTVRGTRHRRYTHPVQGFAADIMVEDQTELRVMLTVTRQ